MAQPETDSNVRPHSHWWVHAGGGVDPFGGPAEKDHEQLKSEIWRQFDYLAERGRSRRIIDKINSTLYSNRHSYSGHLAQALAVAQADGGMIRLNVCRSTTDTLTSRISKNLAIVKVAADGAEWSMRRRARMLSRFIASKLSETKFQRLAPIIFRDACIKGTGVVHVTNAEGEVIIERVPKEDIYVDEREAKMGNPRVLHHKQQFSKEDLASRFEDKQLKHDIMMGGVEREDDDDYDEFDDYDPVELVDVITSYHLPDASGENGWRVVSLRDRVLEATPWTRPHFPFVFFHYSPPERGFWGTGLVEELASLQWSIDQTINILEEGFRLGAPLKVFLPRNARIIKTQFNNRVGAIMEYSGNVPPTIKAPSNPVSQQQISWLLQLYNWSYEISGISLMSATAQVPGGVESGVALRTLHDFETVRFAALEIRYQTLFVDITELIIYEAKDIYGQTRAANDNEVANGKKEPQKKFPHFSTQWIRKDVLQKIKWSDVAIDPGQFKLKLQPTNFVSGTAASQMERVVELAGSNLVPPHWLLALLDRPDLERFYRLQTAMWSYTEWVMEQLMDETKAIPGIASEANLDLVIEHLKAGLLDSITDGAPREILRRIRIFLGSATAKQQKATAAAAPPPQMPPTDLPMPPPSLGGGIPTAQALPPGIDPSTIGAAA